MTNFVGSTCFFLVASLCLQYVSGDTLVIEKITCKHVATGIDSAAKAAVSALGAIIAGGAAAAGKGAVVIGTGGAAIGTLPVTAGAIAGAATSGAKAAKSALEYIDKLVSGKDNLIININGQKVFPTSGKYYDIEAGQTIKPNIRFDFGGKCRIQFIEYDWGSDNDNLGSIDIEDDVSPGQDYRVNEAILFSKEEGDVYYVTYRVERNDKGTKESWLLCGTAACKDCKYPGCTHTSNKGLDRDGDYEDLRQCPPSFKHQGYKHYPQIWPFDDVYLRMCAHFPDDSWTWTSKIWNNDQCKVLGHKTKVTSEQCRAECKNKEGCTAINYARSVLGGDCVLRKCGNPVPDPKWNYKNYNGYYMNDDSWTQTSKIWNNDQCKFLGVKTKVTTAEKCKSECKNKVGCTAVNYAPNVKGGDCVFRKCGIPVQEPKWNHKDYKGYYMNDDTWKQTSYIWTQTSKIWNNDQCKFLGAKTKVTTAEKCKAECKNKEGCTAINYSPNVQGGDCIFRKCGIPVPEPKWNYKNYNGYYLNAN